jgi:LssY C-terminus
VLPEPEIYLPPGTDIRLQLNVPLYVGDQPEVPRVSFAMDEYERGDVEMALKGKSSRTMTGKGKDADLVNLLLVGSSEQVDTAFRASGWVGDDATSTKSVLRQMGAFLTYSNYATAPVSQQYLDGRKQDWTWQKSFNAYGKREHLRIWEQTEKVQGKKVWLGAYIRETGAALSVRNQKFIHHIDRNLDEGVNMLVRDLSLSGCVKSVHLLPRTELPQLMINATGDEMKTDGMLTVVDLQSCEIPTGLLEKSEPLIPVRPRRRATRFLRTQILAYKSDVVRGNILYSVFDLLRMSFHSLRHRHDVEEEDDGAPLSPVSPETLFPQFAVNGVVIEK